MFRQSRLLAAACMLLLGSCLFSARAQSSLPSGKVECTVLFFGEGDYAGESFGFTTGAVDWKGEQEFYYLRDFAKIDVGSFSADDFARSLKFECVIENPSPKKAENMMKFFKVKLYALPFIKENGGDSTSYSLNSCDTRKDGTLFCSGNYPYLWGMDKRSSSAVITFRWANWDPSLRYRPPSPPFPPRPPSPPRNPPNPPRPPSNPPPPFPPPSPEPPMPPSPPPPPSPSPPPFPPPSPPYLAPDTPYAPYNPDTPMPHSLPPSSNNDDSYPPLAYLPPPFGVYPPVYGVYPPSPYDSTPPENNDDDEQVDSPPSMPAVVDSPPPMPVVVDSPPPMPVMVDSPPPMPVVVDSPPPMPVVVDSPPPMPSEDNQNDHSFDPDVDQWPQFPPNPDYPPYLPYSPGYGFQ